MPLAAVGKNHVGETTACRFNHQMVTEKKMRERSCTQVYFGLLTRALQKVTLDQLATCREFKLNGKWKVKLYAYDDLKLVEPNCLRIGMLRRLCFSLNQRYNKISKLPIPRKRTMFLEAGSSFNIFIHTRICVYIGLLSITWQIS